MLGRCLKEVNWWWKGMGIGGEKRPKFVLVIKSLLVHAA